MVEKKLKSSIFGYNKEDVHTYVEDLDREMRAKIIMFENNLTSAQSEARQEREDYERTIRGKDARIDELISAKVASEKALTKAQLTIEELNLMLEKAKNEAQQLTLQLEARAARTADLLEKISVLEAERSRIPSALLIAEEKANEMLESAKLKADTIVSDASALADQRLLSAENEYKKVMAESEDFRRKVIVSRQNLIAAMSAYKKALDEALNVQSPERNETL